uniref:tRNA-dihydrouridine(20/20a) synthase n=1 Tax=Candidatus Kentrum sp. MB TaxID=2138164 RepID=A0A451BD23_9GAMM|nr:MAG: tRNA-U16,U17-dihydrouridine synthase [Candidatus Kentron sp. MB]VFK31930.1 MAG: tRNA-U16,U17-dihydrouridine synthase [Candidatus Kentron sp. MB]VFK76179.1 MAG: tRNA-U16,U17-dihydrouridine synthase [Candidatus Kentron sp. MB]
MIDPFHRRLSVAPMLGRTDRHERFLLRLISRHTLLYTEMMTTGALLHGDSARFLAHDPAEHPVAAQLGGSDPEALARCARLVENHGYDEVNLNCGCPSPRVQSGRFGACLLAEPEQVAECIRAMRGAVSIPVTVKTRIGVDERDSYHELVQFVQRVADAGCDTFIIHARKAWLRGLSPAQNRRIPPLRYDMVHGLKADFPELAIILNGGIQDLDGARQHLCVCDGVMIGRAAYHEPYLLAQADEFIFGDPRPPLSRYEVVERFIPYLEREMANGVPIGRMTRHILGLFTGQPRARAWRRYLSERIHESDAGVRVLRDALRRME